MWSSFVSIPVQHHPLVPFFFRSTIFHFHPRNRNQGYFVPHNMTSHSEEKNYEIYERQIHEREHCHTLRKIMGTHECRTAQELVLMAAQSGRKQEVLTSFLLES